MVNVYSAGKLKVPARVTSCTGGNRPEESRRCRYVYETIHYLVHHHQLGVCAALLQCLPVQISDYLAGAASGLVVAGDKPCCTALNSFQLVDVRDGVRVPCCTGILKDGSSERLVALCFNLLGAAR